MSLRAFVSSTFERLAQLYLSLRKPARKANSLVIVKVDNIGDYVLFRNYIEVLRNHPRFAKHHITLVGNAAWRDLSESFDSQYVDQFHWVDRKLFRNSLRYRFSFLKSLGSYDVLINPTYSRTFDLDDYLVKFIKADHKIGSEADLSNITQSDRVKGDQVYDELIKASEGIKFEFYRYKDFFTSLLNSDIALTKPQIRNTPANERLVVFFPGGTYQSKLWSANNYAQLIDLVVSKLNVTAMICGGPTELAIAKDIMKAVKSPVVDKVGKTTLTELIGIFSRSAVIVGNETGTIHIANALNKKYVCVADGVNLLRFSPYPAEIASGAHIFPPEIMQSIGNIEEIAPLYAQGTYFKAKRSANIEEVRPEQVFELINKCFS